MTETVRWVFFDPATAETWTVPINPDQMSSPHQPRNLVTAWGGNFPDADRQRMIDRAPATAAEWTFSGVIRTKEHYDQLLHWASKSGAIHVKDHLERTFEVIIRQYDPVDRRTTQRVPWRARYTMTCLLLRRVP